MKWDNIEELLQKYYEGETSVAEEQALKTYFNQTEPLPQHLKVHAVQFKHYAQQQEQVVDKYLSEDWLFEKIEAPVPQGRQIFFPKPNNSLYLRIAAGIVLLLGVFWAGNYYRRLQSNSNNPEVAALREEVQEMKKVLASSSSAEYSASERIQVVNQNLSPADGEDAEMIQVLISTMNQDPNVNVRLAACEALYKFKGDQQVRNAFVKSLPLQTDPLMQITLIDMLVEMKEKRAVDPLQKLVQEKDLLPIVKNKAQEGIGILM
ncbi:HEAT repeat domain-containing protein [Pontibacter sp. SGAir0037]|uniref:HEAT repeat domain-containing protein n=1 Tax=Pontibacter sp. SGAir0037 TaxID=2571030 RepID=UPI0010CD5581|nr:HEAT repeat domain-containing protein [Pontibacter sp. SGAir0037]QCR23838.1 HEAT repeat domain-containing protein [Pontibacter sp. SGAir0037]